MIFLFLLGCTAHMNHVHWSTHWIFSPNHVQKMGGVLQLQVWAELGQGRCFPVKGKCLKQHVNVVFASFARFASKFQYSIIKNSSWGACHTSLCAHCNCNYARALLAASNYMATPTTDDIDRSARNYTFHSSVRFSKCDWLATRGITEQYHTSVCILIYSNSLSFENRSINYS